MLLLFIDICLCFSLKVDFIPAVRSPPPFRENMFIDYIKSRESIIVFGGDCVDYYYNDLWEFSLESSFWEKIIITSVEIPRKIYIAARMWFGGFASLTESKFYIFAGLSELGRKNDFWEFDFDTRTWRNIQTYSTPSPIAQYAYTSYFSDGFTFFIIQSGTTMNGLTNDMYRYLLLRLNCSSLQWEKLPNDGDKLLPSLGSMIKYYNGNLLQTGGKYWNLSLTSLYSYSLTSMRWSLISEINIPSDCASRPMNFIYKDSLYLLCSTNYEIENYQYNSIMINLSDDSKELKSLNLHHYLKDYYEIVCVKIENEVYIFGSYTNASKLYYSNSFGKITLNDLKHHLINDHWVQPPPRSYHSMVVINSKLYVFGGVDSGSIYNDLWSFDLISEVWELVLAKGEIPTPRYLHSANSDGDIFIIWGGVSSNGLEDSMFIFNSITGFWTQLKPKTSNSPNPAKGSCLVVKNFKVFIYGGERNSDRLNELWEYDIGTNEFNLLSKDGLQYVTSPFCWLDSDLFYVSLGCLDIGYGSDQIDFFNLTSKNWTVFHNPSEEWFIFPSCFSSQIIFENHVINIGGEYWYSYPLYNITYFGPGNERVDLEDKINFESFASSFVYFNKSLYVYGGGRGGDFFISFFLGNPIFAKIDVEDLCKDLGCEALCSKGTYSTKKTCAPCDAGTFNDKQGSSKCQECQPGTYNKKIAATSKLQCIPCPQGTYNNKSAAIKCEDCPENLFCPVGSTAPITLNDFKKFSSSQPSSYKKPDLSEDLLIFRLLVIIPSFFVLFCCFVIKKLRNYLERLDLYDLQHDNQQSDFIQKKKTTIGGLFTVFFIIGSLMITCSAILTYSKSNIEETKGQVPLIIIESEVSSFESKTLSFSLYLDIFGGQCVNNTECASSIQPTLLNINCSDNQTSCTLHSNKSCIIKVTCFNGIIKTGAQVNLKIAESLSYTSGIQLTFTASSSIPNEESSVSSLLLPSSGYVLIGSIPCEFYFLATPSLFQSESSKWESEITGYHVSEKNSPVYGSQHITDELPFVSNLYVKVLIEINSSVLITKRLLKQDLFFFAGALFGTVSGLFGITGFFMSLFEQYYEKLVKRLKKKKVLSQSKEIKNIGKNAVGKSENIPDVGNMISVTKHNEFLAPNNSPS